MGQGGFSLVEAVVSLFVVSLIFLAVAQLIGIGLVVSRASADLTETTALAAAKMEELRNLSYAQLVEGGSVDADVAGYFDNPDLDGDGTADYLRRWEISDLGGRKRIRVRTISPLAAIGTPKETLLVALVAAE